MDSTCWYNTYCYPFNAIVQRILDCDNLLILHHQLAGDEHADVMNYNFQAGKDQSTQFHQKFYKAVQADSEFLDCYRRFIRDEAAKQFRYQRSHRLSPDDRILFQKIPTFRVHLPNNKSVGGTSHRDADYNHPLGEMNFLVPLTPMRGTSSVFYETSPGAKDYRFKDLDPGNYWIFDGNQCEHGNLPNTMGWTRVSFDFRLIAKSDLMLAKDACSVAYGLKFTEGEYYEAL